MLQTSPTTLLMGGHQDKLIQFDLTEGIETRLVKLIFLSLSFCVSKSLILLPFKCVVY